MKLQHDFFPMMISVVLFGYFVSVSLAVSKLNFPHLAQSASKLRQMGFSVGQIDTSTLGNVDDGSYFDADHFQRCLKTPGNLVGVDVNLKERFHNVRGNGKLRVKPETINLDTSFHHVHSLDQHQLVHDLASKRSKSLDSHQLLIHD